MGASVRCGGRGGLGAKFERGPLAPADNELGGAAGQDAMEPRSLPHRAGYEPQELGSMECEWRGADTCLAGERGCWSSRSWRAPRRRVASLALLARRCEWRSAGISVRRHAPHGVDSNLKQQHSRGRGPNRRIHFMGELGAARPWALSCRATRKASGVPLVLACAACAPPLGLAVGTGAGTC